MGSNSSKSISGFIDTTNYELYLWGAIAGDGSLAHDILSRVEPDDWSRRYWQLIHLDIKEAINNYQDVDYFLSAQRVQVRHGIALEESVGWLGDMSQSTGMVQQYLTEFVDAVTRNKIAKECYKIYLNLHEMNSMEMANKLHKLSLSGKPLSVIADGKQIISNILDKNHVNTYYKTGIAELDRLLGGGLAAGQMVVLAARPGMGKTAFATSLMLLSSKLNDGKVIVFVALEMSAQELYMRLISQYTGIPFKLVKNKQAIDLYGDEYLNKVAELESLPIKIIDTPRTTMSDLRSIARKINNLGCMIIDYLQLVSPERDHGNRNNDVAQMSRDTKGIAKEFAIPVIALSQLNREQDKRNGDGKPSRPKLSDLRDSGAIEQDADIIAFVHRDDYYNKGKKENLQDSVLDVAKHRNGEVGDVPLTFKANCMRFG